MSRFPIIVGLFSLATLVFLIDALMPIRHRARLTAFGLALVTLALMIRYI